MRRLLSRFALSGLLLATLVACAFATKLTVKVVIVDDLVPKPVPFQDFTLTGRDGAAQALKTDEQGSATAEVAEGDYVLSNASPVALKGQAYTWKKSITVSGAEMTVTLTQ